MSTYYVLDMPCRIRNTFLLFVTRATGPMAAHDLTLLLQSFSSPEAAIHLATAIVSIAASGDDKVPSVRRKKEEPWKKRSFPTHVYSSFIRPEDLVDPKVSLEFSILKLFVHLRVISRLLLLFVDSVRLPPISFGILRLIYFVRLWKFISVTNSFSHFLHFACSLLLYLYSWQCFISLPALLAIKFFRSVCFPLYLDIGFHIFTHSLISSSYLSFHSYNSKWTDCKL